MPSCSSIPESDSSFPQRFFLVSLGSSPRLSSKSPGCPGWSLWTPSRPTTMPHPNQGSPGQAQAPDWSLWRPSCLTPTRGEGSSGVQRGSSWISAVGSPWDPLLGLDLWVSCVAPCCVHRASRCKFTSGRRVLFPAVRRECGYSPKCPWVP